MQILPSWLNDEDPIAIHDMLVIFREEMKEKKKSDDELAGLIADMKKK